MRRLSLLVIAVVGAALLSQPSRAHRGVHDLIEEKSAKAAAQPNVESALELAELHRLAGELDAAEAQLERAAAIDPHEPSLDLCRAALALERNRATEASVAIERHLAGFPEDPRALELRARARVLQGDRLGAARDLARVIHGVRSPTPDLYVRRASLLMEAGLDHAAPALATLEAGMERLGRIASLELAAVDIEEATGHPDKALARLDRMSASLRRPGAWLSRRAELLARQGDTDAARWTSAAARAALRDRRQGTQAAVALAAPQGEAPQAQAIPGGQAQPARIAAVVSRGPYIGNASPSRITIRWRTDVATDGQVRYGTSLANLDLTVYDPIATTEHVVHLIGLAADTRYYYSVGTGTEVLSGGDAQTSFVTPPTPGTVKPTRLWVIGDSGTGGSGAASVRDAFAAYAAATRPADLWLMLGDNAYNTGTDAEYQSGVFDLYPALLRSTALWPTRGNHDALYSGANNDYYDIFTLPIAGEAGGLPSGSEAYYSFDYGNIHFICLDSEGSSRAVGGPMAVWLRADLAATPRDWVIAFWHHPPYTKGSHDSDNEFDSAGHMGEMRRNIVPILDSAGVDVVLAGHSHNYERSFLLNGHYGVSSTLTQAMKVDDGNGRWNGDGPYAKPSVGTGPREGCVYVVNGVGAQTGGGSLDHPVMISSMNVLGSLVIDIDGNRLDARFLDMQRAVRDSFTIMKGASTGVPWGAESGGPGLRVLSAQPSRGTVRFGYRLAHAGPARVVMLDALGRRVRVIHSGVQPEGEHEVSWAGEDDQGRTCPAGVYFAVLDAESATSARKIVRLGP
ncbi:MAG TPA: metallophosphoesterase [Candidatus Eisenbacteria bacterium]|nr:metallophosphoesterase [Candidatus Eisenbacteria bacterium]